MLRAGQPFLRVASVAALGVTCLAAAACSGPPDPLASLTGNQVLTEAVANFKAAQNMTVNGLVSQSGTNLVIHVGIAPGQGCTGTVENLVKGDIRFTETGQTLYLKPDDAWWTTVAGAEGTGVGQLVDGRYLKAPVSGMSAKANVCDVAQAVGTNATAGTVVKGQVTTLDGIRVLALNDRRGDTVDVTDTSEPQIAQISEPRPDREGYSGQLAVDVGARVTLTVPPSSQAVDASDFGITADTGAPDPLEDLSTTMLTQAYANLQAASSLTETGSGSESGQAYSLHLGIKANRGCTGTVGYGADGSLKLVVIGSTVYFKPDAAFWRYSAGANATAAMNAVNGRYIEGSDESDSNLKAMAEVCSAYQNVGPSNPIAGISTAAKVSPLSGITMGRVTTLDGVRVLPLRDSTGAAVYLSDTGRLEVAEISQDKAGGGGSYGTFTFDVGAPVTVAAPPASQVLDGSTLGI